MTEKKNWKIRKGKIGRPTKFKDADELARACESYFDYAMSNPIKHGNVDHKRPFFIESLCNHIGIHYDTWMGWNRDNHPEFSVIVSECNQIIRMQKLEGATVGMYSSRIVSRIEGLVEKKETNHNSETLEQWLLGLKERPGKNEKKT